MRPPAVNTLEVYCGNLDCKHRKAGRLFKVIDTTDMTEAERVELLIDGADSFKTVEHADGSKERIQTTEAKPRFDGELIDGQVWFCPDCQSA